MTNYTITSNFDITNLRLSDGAYRCYNLLLSMAYGEKCTVYPSIRFLAVSLGRSCRTINRYIKELISLGYIAKRRRGSISNVYTLLKKKVQQSIDKIKQAKNGSKEEKTAKKSNANNKYKIDKFNDFDQRNYDFNKLEDLLLNGNGNLSDCQIQRE
ncbi:helix-turn-helix domain-containing protein [Clostridium sporogenes]|uniref:helix-turn-helix domain-containing protein n=1 Tax=Clostridium sporogenes TaxID=1509 RepID=UPI0013D57C18|nr:helix-turn-helix domain-containing protein [Clostridium sporogenes]EJO5347003.1 helix-turn-helix domain-containing protein [Clostridium botulinum]MCW6124291.1 helix-turn-helix domain-containing protein [Clostridium sporogenes]NFT27038.1 helix-turn-helix domain-containing protein [Clostridium sporogenes]